MLLNIYGADGGTRTHTPLRITDFESVSSTSSDTSAYSNIDNNNIKLKLKQGILKARIIFLNKIEIMEIKAYNTNDDILLNNKLVGGSYG